MGTRQELGIFILVSLLMFSTLLDYSNHTCLQDAEEISSEQNMVYCPIDSQSMLAAHCVLLGLAIPINAAKAKHLEIIPGIGPTLAKRIVNWREIHGRIESVEEITGVSGVGPRRLAVLSQYVAVKKETDSTP